MYVLHWSSNMLGTWWTLYLFRRIFYIGIKAELNIISHKVEEFVVKLQKSLNWLYVAFTSTGAHNNFWL